MVEITGKIIHGEKIGSKMGYPTANLSRRSLIGKRIGTGVYIARAVLGSRNYIALLIVGVLGVKRLKRGKVEIYCIGLENRDLYGHTISVSVYKKIRPLRRFTDKDLLKKRIHLDIRLAKEYFT